jgi:hypothetical protein
VVDTVLPDTVLPTEFTAGAVAATPFTVLVMVLTELPKVLVVETDDGACFTNAPVELKPNTLVIVPAAGVRVAATPLTVLVSALDAAASVLLLMMETVDPDTPLTVVSNVLAELVLPTEFTAGAVAATPFTVLVMVLTELASV